MRKLILVALLAAFLFPARVQAQSAIEFDSVIVQLWPEFDRSDMLVIYDFTLSAGTALPRDIDFRIPANSEVAVVAVGQTRNTVTDQGIVFDERVDGDWKVVTVRSVSGPAVRLEYYDTLQFNADARHYVYEWPGDYATAELIAIFQQPVDATSLVLDPQPVSSQADSNGLVYYRVNFPALAAGETTRLTAVYQKTTDRLSASLPQVEPSAPLDNNAQGKVSLSAYMPWIVGGAGFLLIVVGLVIGLNYFRGTGQKSGERKRHVPKREEKESDQVQYCPQCGKRAQPSDQFCRTCGARLRRAE